MADLGHHLELWGSLPGAGPALVEEVGRAGLRGRGGAGFPMARKLAAARSGVAGTVVVNAAEGEPASAKDRSLLVASPHLVLDGAAAAAAMVGANDILVCIDRASERAVERVLVAVRERQLQRHDRVRVRLATTPSRYLAGQETALVRWINGGEAKPTTVPPRPTERGVDGRPTLVSNAETFAHLALVARHGAGWFRAVGTEEEPGSALVTVVGGVARPGVYEVPFGVAVGDVVAAAGGDAAASTGVLVGGYFGAWLPPEAASTALSDRALRPWGTSVGSGVIAVAPGGSCGLAESARILHWLAGQSAGQCGPCIHGLPAIGRAMEAVTAGEPSGQAQADLLRWAAMIDGRGACHLPDGAVRFARSALEVFAADVVAHRRRGPCTDETPLFPTPAPGGWR